MWIKEFITVIGLDRLFLFVVVDLSVIRFSFPLREKRWSWSGENGCVTGVKPESV
jgi:hypothetical protein